MTATTAKPRRLGRPILSALVDPAVKAEVERFAVENNRTVSDVVRDGLSRVLGTAGAKPPPPCSATTRTSRRE